MTSRTIVQKTEIPGADSVDAINAPTHAFDPNTIVFDTLQTGRYTKSLSHLASTATTIISTLHTTATVPIHISSPGETQHQVNLHQSRSLRRSAIQRGSPPRNLSFVPRAPFNSFRQSTFLKQQFHPVDTHQDPLRRPFTPCSPLSATVAPFNGLDKNSAPSGVLPDLVKSSHAYLRDVFDGVCDRDGCI